MPSSARVKTRRAVQVQHGPAIKVTSRPTVEAPTRAVQTTIPSRRHRLTERTLRGRR